MKKYKVHCLNWLNQASARSTFADSNASLIDQTKRVDRNTAAKVGGAGELMIPAIPLTPPPLPSC